MRCTAKRPLSHAALSVLCLAGALLAQGTPVGFAEEFALAEDRQKALEQLIPGTGDWYFFQCLDRQHRGAFAEVPPLLAAWIQRHGRDSRVEAIENRQALLQFDRDPGAAWALLRARLGLRFDAQRQVAGSKPDLPERLDPGVIAPAALSARALAMHPGTVDGFRPSAFAALAASSLDDDHLLSLLRRLELPDLPNLPALIVRALRLPQASAFGALPIHKQLTLDQLEELVRLQPPLLQQPEFVAVYLQRLQPGADVNWRRDARARAAHLDALQAFAQRLLPAHNSLKAHVLYHRLWHDLQAGAPDRERFLAYLRLPRRTGYANPDYLQRVVRGNEVVDSAAQFATGLEPIADDTELVTAYLMHFFQAEDGWQPYAEFVREDWLRRVFAETRILAGTGDRERWYSLLNDPGYYEQLKERVELRFPPTQRREFAGDEAVGIDLDVKNVPTLLVKVFQVDAYDYLRTQGRMVDASIDLDGLVANDEQSVNYNEPPLRRVRRHFDFPQLNRPGTYVVEFLGNGIASRAVIQKGRLLLAERVGAAGHVFTLLDEAGTPLPDATLWCGGREYAADAHGEVNVPFLAKAEARNVVLRRGALACLERIQHRAEQYSLQLGVLLDREALLSRRTARLLLRPALRAAGVPVGLDLLEEPELQIAAVDQDGIAATQTVRGLKLDGAAELVQEIAVPPGLATLTVTLRGKVRNLSLSKTEDVAVASGPFTQSVINGTAHTRCPLLSRSAAGYALDVLGKSGEPRADVAVPLRLWHRDYVDPVDVTLKTDARGRVTLGALDGIVRVQATGFAELGAWTLATPERTLPAAVHGVAGAALRVPYLGTATALGREVVALFELRGGHTVRDAFAQAALEPGWIVLRGLQPGDYRLWLKEAGDTVEVRVTAGAVRSGRAVGSERMLELAARPTLQVRSVAAADGALRVQLDQAGARARVHVFATRYLAPFDPFASLRVGGYPEPDAWPIPHGEASYHAGREISDEYRYILERRFAAKFPGNMLRRPSLLLNPWALEESATGAAGVGKGGSRFGAGGRAASAKPAPMSPAPAPNPQAAPGTFPDLDFLPEPSRLLANLRPDKDGVVTIPLADLGAGQLVHVLAVDDDATVYTTLALAEQPLTPRSQTLARSLDPSQHFTEQKRIEFVAPGGTAVLDDVTTASTETYDSLAGVFRLFQTLGRDPQLLQFAFLLRWPELSAEQKALEYSRHACHELHFFLYQKDRAFFDALVRPYLANKARKTFLDHWLLEADLTAYLEPWAFARLNVVERILLTQRVAGQAAAGARHVRDLCELLPVDVDFLGRLFETTLRSDALAVEERLGRVVAQPMERAAGEPEPAADTPALAARGFAKNTRDHRATEEKAKKADRGEDDAKEAELSDETRRLEDLDKAVAGKDLAWRKQQTALYRASDETRLWVEQDWWHRRIEEHTPELIKPNAFWRDYAERAAGTPFASPHFAQASGNVAEMLMALAVLDLPFVAGKTEVTREQNRMTLRPATPLLLVRKEIRPAAAAARGQTQILISQNFFRLDDRYRFEGNERLDNYVSEEFLTDVAYGCQVVLTNPTSAPRKLELLLQVPAGAVPVQKGFRTRGVPVQLQPYATTTVEYAFYFPAAGQYAQYPAHVARDGALVAAAEPMVFKVVVTPSKVDTRSWEHVSQDATADELLAYLGNQNLQRVDLGRIAWRLRDRGLFGQVLERLRGRHVYHQDLWSYGILHQDVAATREYLRHADGFVAQCGAALTSPLLTIDPVERRSYQHVEFEPLFNARAHRFGRRREILNRGLATQYGALLDILTWRSKLDDSDWLSVTYYLLLQDRVPEALRSFAKVDGARLPTRIQYDYLRAYLDFFSADHGAARGIAAGYREHPVERWRQMFQDVLNQLDEVEGKAVAVSDQDSRTQQQTAAAAAAPALELGVESRRVTLRHQNLGQCEVRYYRLDAEFAFSTSPFVQQGGGAFAAVAPNRSDSVSLAAGQKETVFDLPAEFQNSNVLVEVRGAGLVRRQQYFANSLAVQLTEAYGQLKVSHATSGKPLAKVYVKVYARMPGGQVRFYKDGYTDLRGRFDYASLSDPSARSAERLAILVLSEGDGALVREVAPPGR